MSFRNSVIILFVFSFITFGKRYSFTDSSIGVVGCILSGDSLVVEKSEVEGFVVQKLIAKLSSMKTPMTVLDRTKLADIIEEHKIYLSGLVDSYKNEKELDLGSTDYLILARVTGLTSGVTHLTQDEDMSESIELFRETVSYNLSFEILQATTSAVVWSYSKDVLNAEYVEEKSQLNTKKLLFTSLSKSLKEAFEKMERKMRK